MASSVRLEDGPWGCPNVHMTECLRWVLIHFTAQHVMIGGLICHIKMRLHRPSQLLRHPAGENKKLPLHMHPTAVHKQEESEAPQPWVATLNLNHMDPTRVRYASEPMNPPSIPNARNMLGGMYSRGYHIVRPTSITTHGHHFFLEMMNQMPPTRTNSKTVHGSPYGQRCTARHSNTAFRCGPRSLQSRCWRPEAHDEVSINDISRCGRK